MNPGDDRNTRQPQKTKHLIFNSLIRVIYLMLNEIIETDRLKNVTPVSSALTDFNFCKQIVCRITTAPAPAGKSIPHWVTAETAE